MGYRIAAAYAAALLIASPFVLSAAGCSNLPASVEALKPRDARSAYAEAEVLFIGVINSADMLAAKGILTSEQVAKLLPAFVTTSEALDEAFKLLKAGETVAALAKIDFAHADLIRLADALSRANEAATVFAPTPSVWHPVTI